MFNTSISEGLGHSPLPLQQGAFSQLLLCQSITAQTRPQYISNSFQTMLENINNIEQ